MIDVEPVVTAAKIMSDPLIIAVDVRRFRMPFLIVKSAILLRGVRFAPIWLRTALRNVPAPDFMTTAAMLLTPLRKSTERKQQRYRQQSDSSIHSIPPT
jgi:hypothetical protein